MFYWAPNLNLYCFAEHTLLISRQAQKNMIYHSSLPLLETKGTKSSMYGGQGYDIMEGFQNWNV